MLMNLELDEVDTISIQVESRSLFAGTVPSDILFLVKNIDGASSGEMFQKGILSIVDHLKSDK